MRRMVLVGQAVCKTVAVWHVRFDSWPSHQSHTTRRHPVKHWRWYVYGLSLIGAAYSWSCGYWGLAPAGILAAAWALRVDLIMEPKRLPLTDAEIWVWLDDRRR